MLHADGFAPEDAMRKSRFPPFLGPCAANTKRPLHCVVGIEEGPLAILWWIAIVGEVNHFVLAEIEPFPMWNYWWPVFVQLAVCCLML